MNRWKIEKFHRWGKITCATKSAFRKVPRIGFGGSFKLEKSFDLHQGLSKLGDSFKACDIQTAQGPFEPPKTTPSARPWLARWNANEKWNTAKGAYKRVVFDICFLFLSWLVDEIERRKSKNTCVITGETGFRGVFWEHSTSQAPEILRCLGIF